VAPDKGKYETKREDERTEGGKESWASLTVILGVFGALTMRIYSTTLSTGS
jgi:hypothetical protein